MDIFSYAHLPLYLLRFYLFIFRERGRKGETEGEKHQCRVASHVAPTGDLAHNPGMCPDRESNWRPFGSQSTLNPLSYTRKGAHLPFLNLGRCMCLLFFKKLGGSYLLLIFKKDFIYLFLERGKGREKEGEKHQCVVASRMLPY